jgi:hypothetical protein
MKSLHRLPLAALLAIALGFGLVACDEEEDAARIVVDVVSFNQNSPMFADVYSLAGTPEDPEDDFVPVELVDVTFSARPHDDALTLRPGAPFGSVRFTSYDVKFGGGDPDGKDLDGNGSVDLPNFSAAMNVVVPVYGEASAFVLVISGNQKIISPIVDLRMGGEYNADCTITFHGQEETSGEKITLTRGLTVRIADFADAEG